MADGWGGGWMEKEAWESKGVKREMVVAETKNRDSEYD